MTASFTRCSPAKESRSGAWRLTAATRSRLPHLRILKKVSACLLPETRLYFRQTGEAHLKYGDRISMAVVPNVLRAAAGTLNPTFRRTDDGLFMPPAAH